MKAYVDDVDRHFGQVKAARATIVSEPADGFWRRHIYRANDPEGHHWGFSQIGRDLAATDWTLPPGFQRG